MTAGRSRSRSVSIRGMRKAIHCRTVRKVMWEGKWDDQWVWEMRLSSFLGESKSENTQRDAREVHFHTTWQDNCCTKALQTFRRVRQWWQSWCCWRKGARVQQKPVDLADGKNRECKRTQWAALRQTKRFNAGQMTATSGGSSRSRRKSVTRHCH